MGMLCGGCDNAAGGVVGAVLLPVCEAEVAADHLQPANVSRV